MRKIGIPEIEDIATGAALLGAGGGGDPYVGKLVAIGAVQECGPVTLLEPEEVPDDALIHAVCSHGYGITVDIKPEHQMEKVLFAADELTGLIWAAALMRPSKSTKDMELKSLKKKYKSKGFAAGCSREVIEQGAQMLDWELDELLSKTLEAMRSCEDSITEQMEKL